MIVKGHMHTFREPGLGAETPGRGDLPRSRGIGHNRPALNNPPIVRALLVVEMAPGQGGPGQAATAFTRARIRRGWSALIARQATASITVSLTQTFNSNCWRPRRK